MTQLVILDFDGTLADTQPIIIASIQHALRELGLPERSDAECRSIIGLPLTECFERLLTPSPLRGTPPYEGGESNSSPCKGEVPEGRRGITSERGESSMHPCEGGESNSSPCKGEVPEGRSGIPCERGVSSMHPCKGGDPNSSPYEGEVPEGRRGIPCERGESRMYPCEGGESNSSPCKGEVPEGRRGIPCERGESSMHPFEGGESNSSPCKGEVPEGRRGILQGDVRDIAERCADVYRRVFDELNTDGTVRLFPHVLETLKALHDRGLQLAICSSRGRPTLEGFVKTFQLESYVSMVVSANDVEHHKPHPEPVQKILSALGGDPEEAVVVGDANYDILMGRAAGCRTVGVTYGNQSAADLRAAGADWLIDDFSDLISCL